MRKLKVLIASCLITATSLAQDKQNYRIDGIAGAVGEEVILISQIEEEFKAYQSQGMKMEGKCQLFDQLMIQKLMMHQAKKDTLITIDYDVIDRQTDYAVSRMEAQFGSLDGMEEFYKRSEVEIRRELKDNYSSQSYIQQIQQKITSDIDVTPQEVKTFYNKYRYQLPNIGEEVELKQIVIYPKIKEDNKKVLIDKLSVLKKEIEKGESFATKAILNSQDPGSSVNGGLIENVRRGQMVKSFEAVAYNLEEGEISEPFESDFGFHIIKLIKRKGEILDLRHILLQTQPNAEEIKMAMVEMDSIRAKIIRKDIGFNEAVKKYSEDKATRFSAGNIQDPKTGYTKIEKNNLDIKTSIQIVGLDPNDLTTPFEDKIKDKAAIKLIKIVSKNVPHPVDYNLDYERLKKMTSKQKENTILEKWAQEAILDTYIKVDKDFKDCNQIVNWSKTK